MMRLALLATLFFATIAQAETVKFSWDPPTSNADGTPLKLDGYRLFVSPTAGQYAAPATTISKTATSYIYTLPVSLEGKYYVILKAYNTAGESLPSNEVEFVTKPKPQQPSLLKIVP
jgi:hypothetical protein